jgi:hypothetical protein
MVPNHKEFAIIDFGRLLPAGRIVKINGKKVMLKEGEYIDRYDRICPLTRRYDVSKDCRAISFGWMVVIYRRWREVPGNRRKISIGRKTWFDARLICRRASMSLMLGMTSDDEQVEPITSAISWQKRDMTRLAMATLFTPTS